MYIKSKRNRILAVPRFFLCIVFLYGVNQRVCAWKQWKWTGDQNPGERRGHSMSLLGTQVIIFGGRATDTTKEHVPRTYQIQEKEGKLEFITYTEKEVNPDSCTLEDAQAGTCERKSTEVPVGIFYNDIWGYDINCTRWADESCPDAKWQLFDKGSVYGGCTITFGAEICTHPTERWYHGAEIFNDNTLVVYGGFSQRCGDYCDDMWSFDFSDGSWTEVAELGNAIYSPGKRWRFSSVSDGFKMYMFGGFRLWHGFAPQNSEENNWEYLGRYPFGGYLNDFWMYEKKNNEWTQLQKLETCFKVDALEWDRRNDVECSTLWPPARAGHVSVIFNNQIFIHGGYQTKFPYPSTSGPGAGRGTSSSESQGFIPYPTNPYYLDDMWKYNISTGIWIEVKSIGNIRPLPRSDHIMVAAGNIFILFGGYRSNHFYGDTWHYNTTANQWLQLEFFVHPIYPNSCSDDLEARKGLHSGMYYPYEPLSTVPEEDGFTFIPQRHYGTEKFSVLAQPTRGLDISDKEHVFVPQARRQAPGWDGCRDRADGRDDLPQELQWVHPSQRSSHRAVYQKDYKVVLVYGGLGFTEETSFRSDRTVDAVTMGDLWQYSLAYCPKNCSMNGECFYGKCLCHDGYYGLECSNSTCPGSVCDFNEKTKTQTCTHCCFAGYEHTDNDDYVSNIQKLPCTAEDPGYSNGICDGFGKCICQPPFIGEDCSIRDCQHNCSGHGYCSVEFPNSRCMCDMGWIGKYCDTKVCLNNCSYPNGQCINGTCWCSMLFEPYNNTVSYFPFMGLDCSFMVPFAGAISSKALLYGWVFLVFALIAILI